MIGAQCYGTVKPDSKILISEASIMVKFLVIKYMYTCKKNVICVIYDNF